MPATAKSQTKPSRSTKTRSYKGKTKGKGKGKTKAAAQQNPQLVELESLAENLGVRVTYENMTGLSRGSGGLCRVRGELRVIMDRRLRPEEKTQVLADALRKFDTDAFYVSPAVRRMLD